MKAGGNVIPFAFNLSWIWNDCFLGLTAHGLAIALCYIVLKCRQFRKKLTEWINWRDAFLSGRGYEGEMGGKASQTKRLQEHLGAIYLIEKPRW